MDPDDRSRDDDKRTVGPFGSPFGSGVSSVSTPRTTADSMSTYPMNSANQTTGSDSQAGSLGPTEWNPQITEGAVLLGKYEVVGKLGEGAMGAAWQVRHVTLDRERVIKVINPALVQDPGIRMRFAQEAKTMARLEHPNAVRVHDAGIANNGIAFIEMECLKGAPLRSALTPGEPKPLDWVARIAYQLCDVLQEAYSKHRIVHRDLKPENVMLLDGNPGEEVVKVLDFGIAKIIRDETDAEIITNMMQTAGVLGTVAYASPEQNDYDPTTGTHAPVDGRSDLYSLGVMMYEMLTGQRPFRGNLTTLLYHHAHTTPPPFAEVSPELNVPPAVEAVVMRCLAKKPDDRYQTAADLQAAIVEAAATVLPYSQITPSYLHTPIPGLSSREFLIAPPQPQPQPQTDNGNRRKAIWIKLPPLAAGVVALSALIWWLTRSVPIPPPPPPPPPVDVALKQHLANQGYEIPATATLLKGDPLHLKGSIPETLTRTVEGNLPIFYVWNPSHKLFLPKGYEVDASAGLAADGWPRVLLRTVPLGGQNRMTVRFLRIEGTPPGQPFEMGDFHEGPNGTSLSHKVALSGYYIQECETSIGEILSAAETALPAEFKDYLSKLSGAGISDVDALHYPAAKLEREQAGTYAALFNALLATEAQWEYAARSRGQNLVFVGGQTDLSKHWANNYYIYIDNFVDFPARSVDSGDFPLDRTEQGVRYMTGNVQEWCRDRFVEVNVQLSVDDKMVQDPYEPIQGPSDDVVVRGGSAWDSDQTHYKTYGRFYRKYRDTREDLGLRLVLECPVRYLPGPSKDAAQ